MQVLTCTPPEDFMESSEHSFTTRDKVPLILLKFPSRKLLV